ncbi:MAG: NUDIX hydrolase [Geminicoccaceae bacterium]
MTPAFPVSVKAVLRHGNKVVLLKNGRDEWELPGGRMESGETPEEAVTREVEEELGAVIQAGDLIDAWVYHVDDTDILILTYGATLESDPAAFAISDEHEGMDWFALDDLDGLNPK